MNDISVIVKTLDRKRCLIRLLKSIFKYYPTIKVLIADDSEISSKDEIEDKFNKFDIEYYDISYDSGASAGRNYLVSKVKTNFFLLCDDDFVFDKQTDIETAFKILKNTKLDILGGYIRNYKTVSSWWHNLIILGQKIFRYEIPSNYIGTINMKDDEVHLDYKIKSFPEYEKTDMLLQFFLAKTEAVKNNPWDDDLKIQEHTAFFINAKKSNLKMAFTNKISVQHRPVLYKKYNSKRSREYFKLFMEKNKINKVVMTYDIPSRNKTIYRESK